MQRYRDLYQTQLTAPTYLSIGNFDGVHAGHQALLQQMLAAAHRAGAQAGILTFDPHPREVLRPDQPSPSLSTLDERLALLEALGLDFVVVQPFSRATAQVTATEFATLLVNRLHVRELWVGPDFALGHKRQGTVSFLQEIGARLGFTVQVAATFWQDGHEVRSGAIRSLIESGDVRTAARLLGHPYTLTGVVVKGDQRGATIGFPTANLAVAANRLLPANGVYATWVVLPWERRAAVTNIGVRPTFSGQGRSIEAHILDFSGDLYGQSFALEFVQRLRPEQRFDGIEALIAQIRVDAAQARALLTFAAEDAGHSLIYEELEHTADWAVRIFGRDLPTLFAHAGETLFRLIQTPFAAPPQVTRQVQVEGADLEMLLVRWLQELLYLMETEGELYTQFSIEALTPPAGAEPARLTATVAGIRGRSDRSPIKAVTYHDLSVSQTDDGWQATVLFDT
ncbi:MAG: bifunctional riboflavin kinase/FAD synthetase [Anaerolineae bacterium]